MEQSAEHSDAASRIGAIRRFNRFFTRQLGVLGKSLPESGFSLPEARLLFELAQSETLTAAELARDLGLDPGYLSRLLRGLERTGLIEQQPSPADRRKRRLALTADGRAAFAELDALANAQANALLGQLPATGQMELVRAMQTIERLVAPNAGFQTVTLRPHRTGDMGWIVERHAALYSSEHGWDGSFEAFVARTVAALIESFDARRERAWIAELDGRRVGSAALVAIDDEVAQLRLLLVEPDARGHGLGRQLVQECLAFAREAGYRRVRLWTHDMLIAARRLYEREGFSLTSKEASHSFGKELVTEIWETDLS